MVRRSASWFEDGVNWNITTLFVKAISDKMTVNLNVLGPLIKYKIFGNVDSRSVITMHGHASRLFKIKLHQ